MAGGHDPVLVCVSILIAIAASYTALDLGGRIRASEGVLRRVWLCTAAVAMGGGIWAMHFVAMLAFQMPGMELGYDFGLTLLSLIVAILVTGIGFAVMSRAGGSLALLAQAGVLMGIGIVAMHYVGMAAMRMSADLRYDPLWFAISVAIAIGASIAALWLASRDRHPLERVGAAIVMGGAVAGMHYAGMQAAIFTVHAGHQHNPAADAGSSTLAIGVSTATFLILFMSLIAAMFDRRFASLAAREAEALRESEERFRALYRGAPLPLHALDREGRIDKVSNAWLDLLGYARDEVVGRPIINFLTEASARQFVQHDLPELLREGAIAEHEYRAVTRNGAFLDLVSTMRVEHDATGSFRSIVGGFTDVTGRKQAEEALRQAQKLEAIGQLTGGIAHDFNNLLAVIVGNLELLRKRLPDDPKTQRLLEGAWEGAQRGSSLTQRLLAFARRQDLRPKPVAVAELVQGMTALLRRSLGPTVWVETHFPLDLPHALVDAHQLEMALLNLAVNARDAMPDGGVIDISAAEAVVGKGEAGELAPGRYVKVTLSDNGAGMDEETLRRATDPFFTTKGLGKGTGLGLSMVQGLAAQSGGRLLLSSIVGRGTTASLYLPVANAPAAEEPAKKSRAVETMPAATILAVDDDALVLENTAAMLEDMGHHVHRAPSAAAALDLLETQDAVDLVVTDQAMPGMSGLELIALLQARRPDLPILLVSGLVDIDPARISDVDVLPKPFTQDKLAAAVRKLLGAGQVVPIDRKRRRPKP